MKLYINHLKKLTFVSLLFTLMFSFSCSEKAKEETIKPENWSQRYINIKPNDSLEYGKSYLAVYSQIYSNSEHRTHNLTVMVSLRNTSDEDTIYITKASYFDTHGKLLNTYFSKPIYLAPLETTEIIIDEIDVAGGTGSNFIFEWKTPKNCPEPIFEGIMNSTKGQQGLSFTTQAKRIK